MNERERSYEEERKMKIEDKFEVIRMEEDEIEEDKEKIEEEEGKI